MVGMFISYAIHKSDRFFAILNSFAFPDYKFDIRSIIVVLVCYKTAFSFMICFQGVSAVRAFYELLSQSSLSVLHPEENKPVAPVELCPILKTLYKVLITRYLIS